MGRTPTARELYNGLVKYLLSRDWYRDGDDPGIWRHGGGINPPGFPFGEAVQIQLEKDGINMQWTP